MYLKIPGDMHNDKGASAVEFAIVLPVLLLVIFGIIEWGLYMYNRQVITNAAREVTRYGVLDRRQAPGDEDAERQKIQNKFEDWAAENVGLVTFGTDELTVDDLTITRPPDDGLEFGSDDSDVFSNGSDLMVTVTYEYKFLFLSAIGLVEKLDIEGTSTMKME